jgi:FkbM family methyltransferase
MTSSIRRRANYLRLVGKTLGYRQAAWHLVRERLDSREPGSTAGYRPRGADHPLRVRRGTTDWEVLLHVFGAREYACLDDLEDVGLVLDCGANVGYASAYFLSRHPHSEVVAVEPDPENYAALETNLSPYGSRARVFRAAVWSSETSLVMAAEAFRDEGAWARHVREAAPGERADVRAVDIPAALALSGRDRISILKMDIEGAEAVVFSGNCDHWLPKVEAIAIELHDDSSFGRASEIFFRAIASQGFTATRRGELTVCRRPR